MPTDSFCADLREDQARAFWDRGFGRELRLADFDDYLKGLPMIPETLVAPRSPFTLLCLADPRPGLSRSCSLLGIWFKELGYTDADAVLYDDRHATPTEPFWYRFTAPGTNMNRRPSVCRDEFIAKDNFASTAMTGIMAYAHHPTLIEEGKRVLDLPGSQHRRSGSGAYLGVWGGRPRLYLDRHDSAVPNYGAGGFCRE